MNLIAQHTHFFGILIMVFGTLYLFIVRHKLKSFKPIGAMEYEKHKRFGRTIYYSIFAFILHIYASVVFTYYRHFKESLIIEPEGVWLTLDIVFTFAYVSALILILRGVAHSAKKYIIFFKKEPSDKPYSDKYKV
jgi:hypothetical protein